MHHNHAEVPFITHAFRAKFIHRAKTETTSIPKIYDDEISPIQKRIKIACWPWKGKENDLFNDALNTFYLRLFGVGYQNIIARILSAVIPQFAAVKTIITYEEQHNKGHIDRTISHVCHSKIVRPLGNFVACDWL